MVQYCCVPLCKSYSGLHFPKDKQLRDKWRVAVKKAVSGNKSKLWEPSKHDIVCHRHFKPDDYTQTHMGERKSLKKGVIPSVFLERMTDSDAKTAKRRQMRRERAEGRSSGRATATSTDVMDISDVQLEMEVQTESTNEGCDEKDNVTAKDVSIQCSLLSDRSGQYDIENFKYNPQAIKYYTGFDTYDHFMMLFSILGPAVNHLNIKCSAVDPKNQLFLTLMKLRLNKEDYEISLFFRISQPTISIIIATWINFIYFQLKEINFWPDQSIVSQYMPEDFHRKFPSSRVILDATEVPVRKPSNVSAQSSTFSTYKHKNTLKTMIGISPRGLVIVMGHRFKKIIDHRLESVGCSDVVNRLLSDCTSASNK